MTKQELLETMRIEIREAQYNDDSEYANGYENGLKYALEIVEEFVNSKQEPCAICASYNLTRVICEPQKNIGMNVKYCPSCGKGVVK